MADRSDHTPKREIVMTLLSTITCPQCGHAKEETMPTDSCLFFYECENCRTRLKPKPGDCCVFCSYGTEKCPSVHSMTGGLKSYGPTDPASV